MGKNFEELIQILTLGQNIKIIVEKVDSTKYQNIKSDQRSQKFNPDFKQTIWPAITSYVPHINQ